MSAVVTFPSFEKYGGVKRAQMVKSGVGVEFPKQGISYPAALALLWPAKLSNSGVLKSAKGPAPTYTDTPTLSAGGVIPGDGPSFSSAVTWSDGGTLVVEFTANIASADIVADVQVFGPLYAYSGGLKAKDGTNTATVATSWASGDVVTATVQTLGTEMRLGNGVRYSPWITFDETMPEMAFAADAPGKLKKVEEWKKVTSLAGYKAYPLDAILYYDTDLDPTIEQVGLGHTFNSAILSPQYQRNADGSYTNVGANPAVDVIDGEKWLRSCGAVTNLLPGDTSQARSVSLTAQTYTLQVFGAGTVSCSYGTASVGAPLTFTATAGSTTFTPSGATLWMLTATAYPVPYTPPGTTMPASNATTTNGCWFTLADGSPVWKALDGDVDGVELAGVAATYTQGTNSLNAYSATTRALRLHSLTGEWSAIYLPNIHPVNSRFRLEITNYNAAAGAVKITGITAFGTLTGIEADIPGNGVYIVTMAEGTTFAFARKMAAALNDVSFNISIQRIQPQPLTLATRVRMGVGSGDSVGTTTNRSVVSWRGDAADHGFRSEPVESNVAIMQTYDSGGGLSARIKATWPRSSIIRRVTQVNTAGTQFRVGYMIEGTHTTIQWGSWATYDGSFDPSTLYSLMLGYNNPYPMWFSRITAWREQVSDARILEALNG